MPLHYKERVAIQVEENDGRLKSLRSGGTQLSAQDREETEQVQCLSCLTEGVLRAHSVLTSVSFRNYVRPECKCSPPYLVCPYVGPQGLTVALG